MAVKKTRVILRWTGRTLLVLLAILALFIVEENIRGRIMLARYKAELRAKGEKLTLAEFNLPKPTVSSDAAVVLLQVGSELEELGKQSPFLPLWEFEVCRLHFTGPGCCTVRHVQADSGLMLRNMDVAATPSGSRRYQPVTQEICSWEQLADQVGLARELLHRARAALQQSVIAVPTDYRKGFDACIPQERAAAHISAWLSAAALFDLHQNEPDTALESILAIADLLRFLQDDHLIESQSERSLIGKRGLDITWEALQAPAWTDGQLAKLQMTWEKASIISEFLGGAEGERAIALDEWEREVRKPINQLLNWSDFSLSSWEDVCGWAQAITWFMAWKQQDETRGVWVWQNTMEDVRSAVHASTWMAAHKQFEETEHEEWDHWSFYDHWRYHMSKPGFPMSSRIVPVNVRFYVQKLLEYETEREMTVAALALARYQLRHGKMPANLAALVPEFCAKIPHDYMDGANLRYRLNGDGTWILYSVGDDGVDNGGDPRPLEPRGLLFSIWDGRDAVWPQPTTQNEVEAWEPKRSQQRQPSGRSQR